MEKILMMLLEVSLMMSILILIMIVLKPFFNKKYGVRMRYFIWLFIALRLLLPFNVSFPKAVEIQVNPSQSTFVVPSRIMTESTINNRIESEINLSQTKPTLPVSSNRVESTPQKTVSLFSVIFIVWLSGFVVVLMYQIGIYFKYSYKVKRNCIECSGKMNQVLYEIQSKYKNKSNLKIYENVNVSSPMLLGFIKPRIILTDLSLPINQQKIIIEHELVHHLRHDLYYKLVLLLVRSIHWFNPIVYLMLREANNDIEFSCDETVLRNSSIDFRKDYGNTILALLKSTASRKGSSNLTTSFNGNKKVVKERFGMLIDTRKKSKGAKIILLSIILVAIIASLVSCTQKKKIGEDAYVEEIEDTLVYTFYDDIEFIFAKSDQITIDSIEKKDGQGYEYITFIVKFPNEKNQDTEINMAVLNFNDKEFKSWKTPPGYENGRVYFRNSDYVIHFASTDMEESYYKMKRNFRYKYKGKEITNENIDEHINACSLILLDENSNLIELQIDEYSEVLGKNAYAYSNYNSVDLPYVYKINEAIFEQCNLSSAYPIEYVIPTVVDIKLSFEEFKESNYYYPFYINYVNKRFKATKDSVILIEDTSILEKMDVVYKDEYSKKLDKNKADYEIVDGWKSYELSERLTFKIPSFVSDSIKVSFDEGTDEVWIYYEYGDNMKIPLDHRYENEKGTQRIGLGSLDSFQFNLITYPEIDLSKQEIIPVVSTISDKDAYQLINDRKALEQQSFFTYQ